MNKRYSILATNAVTILKKNDRGAYTVPSSKLYPHQWAWDSAFAAIGWSFLDPERALLELETLFSAQWQDGRVPHIRFDPNSHGYTPGPELWGCGGTTSITQPPVYAYTLQRLLQTKLPEERLKKLGERIEKAHRFFVEQRDPHGIGCVAVVHPWESGLDNCPAWDEPLQAVDPDYAPPFERTDRKVVTDQSQRPTDDQYRRYMAIVRQIRENGFMSGDFAVYDPFMTAILIHADELLLAASGKLGFESDAASRIEYLTTGMMKHLWNAELRSFGYIDSLSNRYNVLEILPALMPLVVEALPLDIRHILLEKLKQNFKTDWRFPTVSPCAAEFDPYCYWRGPVWMNMNWLLSKAGLNQVAEISLSLIEISGFREYYHPESGTGLGAEQFTWTAALALDWIHQLNQAESHPSD